MAGRDLQVVEIRLTIEATPMTTSGSRPLSLRRPASSTEILEIRDSSNPSPPVIYPRTRQVLPIGTGVGK